jgi:hypothetical protein
MQEATAGQNVNSQELNKDSQNRQRGNTQAQQYQGRTASAGAQGARSMGGGRRGYEFKMDREMS